MCCFCNYLVFLLHFLAKFLCCRRLNRIIEMILKTTTMNWILFSWSYALSTFSSFYNLLILKAGLANALLVLHLPILFCVFLLGVYCLFWLKSSIVVAVNIPLHFGFLWYTRKCLQPLFAEVFLLYNYAAFFSLSDFFLFSLLKVS